MIVYFEKPTLIKQHGLISKCMFIECLRIDFAVSKAVLSFGMGDDFDIVDLNEILRIE